MKMLRFFDAENGSVPLVNSTIDHIDQLDRFIQIAREKCHFPSKHNLTRDESAAIYLYTMEWEKDIFYRTLRGDLRSNPEAWLPYLKLFDTAVKKLPNTQVNVWRGEKEDICKKWKKDEEFVWWNYTSCSSTENVIKDCLVPNCTACFIEAINGKDISMYSAWPNQNEIILCPGTRLRVVSHTQNQPSSLLHLQECDQQVVNSKKRVFSLLPPLIALIVALLVGMMFGKTWITHQSSSPIDQPPTFYTYVDAHGNRYEGKWFNGKKHGNGKMSYANGCTYMGDWVDDTATGEGIFTWSNEDRYEGQIRDGRRHGKGSYYFANGDTYVGGWVDDKKSGHGISSLSSGRYEGEFKDDKMHGKGSFYFPNGDTYVGNWSDDKQEGEGIFRWANGDRYEGGFKAGRLHGEGSYYFPNGNKFEGEWSNGERVVDHGGFTWTHTDGKSKDNKTGEDLTETKHKIK